jgi:hypothetical protein
MALVVACALSAYGVLYLSHLHKHYTKTNLTINLLVRIGLDFDPDAPDAQQFFSNLPPRVDSLTLNRQLAAFLYSRKSNFISLEGQIASDGLFRDAWGTPICFLCTNNPAISNLNPQILNRGKPFVFWSAGLNQKDELGFGDDLSPDKP